MRIAFKEWAIVVDALGRGEQIVILRKGGINEGPGGFQVEHQHFLIFPTIYHQKRENVVPSVQARLDNIVPTTQGHARMLNDIHCGVDPSLWITIILDM